jgi:hypothetical protein
MPVDMRPAVEVSLRLFLMVGGVLINEADGRYGVPATPVVRLDFNLPSKLQACRHRDGARTYRHYLPLSRH